MVEYHKYVAVHSDGRVLWQTEAATEERSANKAKAAGVECFRVEKVSDVWVDPARWIRKDE